MLKSPSGCRRRYGGSRGLARSVALRALSLAMLAGLASAAPEGLISVIDLTGRAAPGPWSLANANSSVAVSGVSLPAYVHQVLEEKKVIPDPLVRFNEAELAWVHNDTWTFTREFKLDAPWTGGELVLDGVDTIADVKLNGHFLGSIENEFRTHRLPVAAGTSVMRLAPQVNKLEITIKSANKEADARAAAYPHPVPSIAHVATFAGTKPFVRKAGADFGWDWGPALGPAGIFGNIYLLAAAPTAGKAPGTAKAGSYLQAALVRQLFNKDKIKLTVHAVVARPAGASSNAEPIEGTLDFSIPSLGVKVSKKLSAAEAASACKVQPGGAGGVACDVFAVVEVEKAKVELWWPAGHGAQKLYDSTVTWTPAGVPAVCDAASALDADDPVLGAASAPAATKFGCSVAKREIGFRTIELVTVSPAEGAKELAPGKPAPTGADAEGETMYIRVNGVAMFMKGANLIPFHTIRTMVTPERVNATMQGALDVHFNMLRVWGGGIYLPNDFYQMADRVGMLLWQEAMFACAHYPSDEAFLNEVRLEMREQVLRLGSHTSLAVWGGNNENEVGFVWFAESRDDPEFYRKEYVKLYFDTVGEEITKLDPETPFVDSSPANGPFYTGAKPDGTYSAPLSQQLAVKRWGDAQSPKFGDVHYYNNEDDCTAPGIVPEARMLSEFGWQSDAPWYSIKSVTPPEDWDTWAPSAQYRQRWNTNGTAIKTAQMGKVFGGLPNHSFKSAAAEQRAALYSDWIYLRQMHQSICYDFTISMMRRKMRDPARLSAGTLYWQLNDVWQGASWSSIDYELRWKPVHYALQRNYAPVQVIPFSPDSGKTVAVDVSYDESRPIPSPIQIKITVHPLEGCGKGTVVGDFTVPAGTPSGVVWSSAADALLAKRAGCSSTNCFLRVAAVEAAGTASPDRARRGPGSILGVPVGAAQFSSYFFAKFNALALPVTSLRPRDFHQIDDHTVQFTITAAGGAAIGAFWDTQPAGHFDINNAELVPCETVKVTFHSVDPVAAAEVERTLQIWTYNGALQGKQVGGMPAERAATMLESTRAMAAAEAAQGAKRGGEKAAKPAKPAKAEGEKGAKPAKPTKAEGDKAAKPAKADGKQNGGNGKDGVPRQMLRS